MTKLILLEILKSTAIVLAISACVVGFIGLMWFLAGVATWIPFAIVILYWIGLVYYYRRDTRDKTND